MGTKAKGKNTWQDKRTVLAKKQGYPARSVFKLKEIQKRYSVLRPGSRVLDLGCAPGSWLMYCSQVLGPEGLVTGVDLSPLNMTLRPNMRVVTADIYNTEIIALDPEQHGFDAVISDMAPNTSGIRDSDALRSSALCEHALWIADQALKRRGNFVCKIFQGPGFDDVLFAVRERFGKHRIFKPESTRKKSREIYIIGLDKKSPRASYDG